MDNGRKDAPINPDRRRILAAGVALAAASTASPGLPRADARAPAVLRNLPDVAIVGAGAFGGWAALSLREAGAKVALIDAYGPGNPRASSGDESRLLRLSYGERAIYSRWSQRAQALWEERQEMFGRRMFYNNGSLRYVSASAMGPQKAVFEQLGIPYEVLTPDEVHYRWPQVDFSEYDQVFYETTGGIVKARESMIGVAEAFARIGGEVRVGHAVPATGPGGAPLSVDGEAFPAGLCVFACGPWLPKLFPQLLGDKIRVPRREIFYVGSPIDNHAYRWENLPNISDSDTYTASDVDYGIKVAARLRDLVMDPDNGDRMPTSFLRQQVEDYVSKRMPGLKGQPIVATRVCQTEYSDNSHFIIDLHPERDDLWIAGAGSGHAFKMGPAIGEYIANRVLGRSRDAEADRLFSLASHKAVAAI